MSVRAALATGADYALADNADSGSAGPATPLQGVK